MNLAMETTEPHKLFITSLREVVSEQQVDQLIDCLYDWYYGFERRIGETPPDKDVVSTLYVKAINDIVNLPLTDQTGIVHVTPDPVDASDVDVTYETFDVESPGVPVSSGYSSIQFVPWEELAYSQLHIHGGDTITGLANLLHEMTFWGFTSIENKDASMSFGEPESVEHYKDINTLFHELTGI